MDRVTLDNPLKTLAIDSIAKNKKLKRNKIHKSVFCPIMFVEAPQAFLLLVAGCYENCCWDFGKKQIYASAKHINSFSFSWEKTFFTMKEKRLRKLKEKAC